MGTSLASKRCLITGGSRGIGFAIAGLFAKSGASCILLAQDKDRLEQATLALPRAQDNDGVNHHYLVGDVGDSEFWKFALESQPKIDILVNAAGVSHVNLLAKSSYESIERSIRTNLLGSIYGCRTYIKPMMSQRRGCIINISSVLGIRGGKGSVPYAAAKAGIIGLTKSLADEVGRVNVRVNAICPGYIKTDMTGSFSDEEVDRIKQRTPLGRMGTAEEIASTALHIATNEFYNGAVFTVDGGLSVAS